MKQRLKRLFCKHKHCKITNEVITRDLYKNPYYWTATSYRYETKITCKCLKCWKIIEKDSTK